MGWTTGFDFYGKTIKQCCIEEFESDSEFKKINLDFIDKTGSISDGAYWRLFRDEDGSIHSLCFLVSLNKTRGEFSYKLLTTKDGVYKTPSKRIYNAMKNQDLSKLLDWEKDWLERVSKKFERSGKGNYYVVKNSGLSADGKDIAILLKIKPRAYVCYTADGTIVGTYKFTGMSRQDYIRCETLEKAIEAMKSEGYL